VDDGDYRMSLSYLRNQGNIGSSGLAPSGASPSGTVDLGEGVLSISRIGPYMGCQYITPDGPITSTAPMTKRMVFLLTAVLLE